MPRCWNATKCFGGSASSAWSSAPVAGRFNFCAPPKPSCNRRRHLLAVTPQGRFADVRERPVHFEAGLGHLAARVQRALFVPFAVEYVFWEERLPEILVRFGEPVEVRREHAAAFEPKYWTRLFEEKLDCRRRTRWRSKPNAATPTIFNGSCAAARARAAFTIGGAGSGRSCAEKRSARSTAANEPGHFLL